MPKHPSQPSIPGNINDIAQRLRVVERLSSGALPEFPEVDIDQLPAYSWQSAQNLTVGNGLRLYADRAGRIVYCRAERSSGDGSTTATLDVLKNGTSIFPTGSKPTVSAGDFLGPERTPDTVAFDKGDYFIIEVEATGGGTGPLRVTIRFQEDS